MIERYAAPTTNGLRTKIMLDKCGLDRCELAALAFVKSAAAAITTIWSRYSLVNVPVFGLKRSTGRPLVDRYTAQPLEKF